MSDALNDARRYLAEIPEQAMAAALVSIAESLAVIARGVQIEHGTCADCGHAWTLHNLTGCEGHYFNGVRGVTECVCTEPRPQP